MTGKPSYISRFLLSVLLSAGLLSCTREPIDYGTGDSSAETRTLTVKVDMGGDSQQETKAELQTADEKKINSLDVFVFKGSFLEAHVRIASSAAVMGIPVTPGEKTVWAFCNYATSRMATITSLEAAESFSTLLTDNSRAGLSMRGHGTKTVSLSDSEPAITITVRRDVAKVQLAGPPTLSGEMAGGTYNGMYLINIPKAYSESTVLTSSSASDAWNFNDRVATSVEQSSLTLTSSYGPASGLYGMPNASPESVSAEDRDYTTKAVFKCTQGGVVYWYPISIPGISANKLYTLSNVVISTKGSDSPNEYVHDHETSYALSVADWVTQTVTNDLHPGTGWGI